MAAPFTPIPWPRDRTLAVGPRRASDWLLPEPFSRLSPDPKFRRELRSCRWALRAGANYGPASPALCVEWYYASRRAAPLFAPKLRPASSTPSGCTELRAASPPCTEHLAAVHLRRQARTRAEDLTGQKGQLDRGMGYFEGVKVSQERASVVFGMFRLGLASVTVG